MLELRRSSLTFSTPNTHNPSAPQYLKKPSRPTRAMAYTQAQLDRAAALLKIRRGVVDEKKQLEDKIMKAFNTSADIELTDDDVRLDLLQQKIVDIDAALCKLKH